MSNYVIWKTEFNDIMIEILEVNTIADIVEVQKEFLDKGYMIIQICMGVFDDHTFMRVRKMSNE